MATRLRYLTAALVAGLAFSFMPTVPARADEPGIRAPRVRIPPPRVRTVVRVRYVPVYYTSVCGGFAHPVMWHAPRYYTVGCGGCALPVALPYYWAVRYARYHHAHRYYY